MLEYWYKALRSPYGVIIRTDDPVRMKQKLYQARAEVKDKDLDGIAICSSPTNETHLWLVKK